MVERTGPAALDGGRDRRRTALVAAPWVLAAVLGVVGVVAGGRGATDQPTAAPPSTPSPPTTPAPLPSATASGTTGLAIDPSGPSAALPPDVELAVLLAARAAMGTAGLAAADGSGDRWTLEVRVTALEAVTDEHAVARVDGLVIEARDDGWHGPFPAAVAVLVRTAPTPAVVGSAWPLAALDLPTASPSVRPVDDPDPGLVAPLQDNGWTITEVTAVEAADDALLRVRLSGTAPGAARTADHVVWLLDGPNGPRPLPLPHPDTPEDLP